MSKGLNQDNNHLETNEWLESLDSLILNEGSERAEYIIKELLSHANDKKINIDASLSSNYINTISYEDEIPYPGDISIETKISSATRWNALMIVQKAQKKDLDLGGHLSSYQSSADIYEVCFNHFFRADNDIDGGDLVYFQGHISPGIYSRAFLEGRLTQEQIDNFRQEVHGKGISSYPHPKLMPDFWQFPTVSMGLGPVSAIYQARFLKYLENRGLKDTSKQTVYAFLGDGEMDEIESKGGISIAGREGLDNLIFVINCNLQRLDGPVFGNGKIVNELEGIFSGAKWKVIKLLWGSDWDNLFKKDKSGKLLQLVNETVDGFFQDIRSKDGSYIRENFFGKYPETLELVKDLTDDEIYNLKLGGHDLKKIYNAFKQAKETTGKPVVILVQTVKGYGMGKAAESRNNAHQVKKVDETSLKHIRDIFNVPFNDEEIVKLPYWTFKEDSVEYKYLHDKRKALLGYLPKRRQQSNIPFKAPELSEFDNVINAHAQGRPISTTLAFVRILYKLLENQDIGKQIVPILADESRTFGLEGTFKKVGIYSPFGQNYTPEDIKSPAYYKEDKKGQLLQEGINELGATSSWLAAATSYSTNNLPMIPFFIYYSMFGFQRVGDMLWLAGDQRARGFMIGGTSGRTTLNGEGLQHQDGHSHILANTIPNCISYDPAYGYELAIIIQDGIKRMYVDKEDIYYYITTLNESYDQPEMPKGCEEGVRKGIYKFSTIKSDKEFSKVQLLGCGSIMRHVVEAANYLSTLGVSSDLFSVTSFNELTREAYSVEHYNNLHPTETQKVPYISNVLADLPTIAATDYIRLYADQIRAFVPSKNYKVLGTDGFGRSDSRLNLREHFEVNYKHIVIASLNQLVKEGKYDAKKVNAIIKQFEIDTNKPFSLYA